HEPLVQTHPPGLRARLTRWARRKPGLAARLGAVAACSAIIWANRLAMSAGLYGPPRAGWSLGPLSLDRGWLTWADQLLFLAWAVASVGFQHALDRRGWSRGIICAWLAADVACLTALLMLNDALASPLTVAYAVLIAASGLWSRWRIVAATTALAMAGYAALVVETWLAGEPLGYAYWHLHFLAGLAILGCITAHQVRRLRALGRFIEGRASP
ncbi:MAG: hypothetical protein K2X91_05400, partial [Thermoleophilia bacterium]|nr:hypothetical protein [Thermoleophilia bacterium]